MLPGGRRHRSSPALSRVPSVVLAPAPPRRRALVGVVAALLLAAACSSPDETADGSDATIEAGTSSTTWPMPTTAPTTAAPATAAPTTADGTIFRAESASFTSPSGNIACSLSSSGGASCYIAEKQWTIEQPAGCDDGDFGNAVDLGPGGATFSCYTDFAWDLNAPPLAYGDASAAGEYICESDETGVTCTNGAGQGFKIARARVDVF